MMNKFRLPLAIFKSSQSNLCLIPSWPNFQNISQPTSPDEKDSSLILLLLSRFHGPSLFPRRTSSFSSTYNLWWLTWRHFSIGSVQSWEFYYIEDKGLGRKRETVKGKLGCWGWNWSTPIHTHWFKVLPLSELNTKPNIHSNLIVCTILYIPPHQN